MFQTAVVSGLMIVLTAAAPLPPAGGAKEKDREVETRKILASSVSFNGFDRDERRTLMDALDELSEVYGLQLDVNETAFRNEIPPVPEVLNTPMTAKVGISKMQNVRLDSVLRKVLDRIPTTSGVTFIVRRDRIEITTIEALHKEILGNSARPLLPLVYARFNEISLSEALKNFADQADFNIILDQRALDKVKTGITIRLTNVPLDTAVRMIADMAGLSMVQLDNSIYVTSKESAKKLDKEQQERKTREQPPVIPPIGPFGLPVFP